jgi:hypothetical protein
MVGGAAMASREYRTAAEHGRTWIAWIKFVWIVLLTVVFFLLAQSMVRHHFFSGGALNYRSTAIHP